MRTPNPGRLVPGRSWIGAAALSIAAAAATHAQTVTYRVCLDGGQESPPVVTAASGTATVTLDTTTGAVSVSGSYSNLGSNQTAAHLHGPAPIGMNGPVIITLAGTGGTSGTFSGGGTLTAMEIADMQAGDHYLNVHTVNEGGGELRGQVVQLETVDCPAELVGDPVLTDCGGDPDYGPKIDDAVETFNLQLDCSGSGGPGFYRIILRLGKRPAPVPTGNGTLWCSNPVLFKCKGMHTQNVVKCFANPGLTLPNEVSFVGISYCAQGFCEDPTNPLGRLSNALVETVGI